MFTIRGERRHEVLVAIDKGLATKVVDACFVQGYEDENRIDFYQVDRMIVRCEYAGRTTETHLDEVTGEDLDLFKTIYHLH